MRAYEKIKDCILGVTRNPSFQLGCVILGIFASIFIMYIIEANNHESENNDSIVSVVTSSTMSQPTTTRSTTPITDEVTTSVSETQSSVSTTQETTTSTTTTTPVVTTKKKVTTVATTKVEPITEPESVITEPPVEETPPAEEIPSTPPEESIPVDTSGRPVIHDCTLSDDVQQYIYDKCNQYGVPYELIMAIMKKESTFRPGARNGPCVGLMQLNEKYNSATASSLGVSLYDAKGNALVGIIKVSDLLSRYSIHDALMCYNMGEYGAKKYLGGSTSYSRKVVQYYNEYLGK